MRKKMIAGNWKMNMLPNETIDFIQKLEPLIKNSENEVILCVPYIDLFYANMQAQNTNIKIGAQNMHWEDNGAYTGEISAKMLKAIGVEYVIIGHSERRKNFAETDEIVHDKLKKALQIELKPIVCIGETLDEKEKGLAQQIINEQLTVILKDLTKEQIENTIIAYEPIWAIGTGKTATSEYANDIIKTIRNEISKNYGQNIAEKVIILYGGSIKSSNAKELFTSTDIDGGLIGGSSLEIDEFEKIVNYNLAKEDNIK